MIKNRLTIYAIIANNAKGQNCINFWYNTRPFPLIYDYFLGKTYDIYQPSFYKEERGKW